MLLIFRSDPTGVQSAAAPKRDRQFFRNATQRINMETRELIGASANFRALLDEVNLVAKVD